MQRPFNFEQAKAGNAVITAAGDTVDDFTYLPTANTFVGTIDGTLFRWDESGEEMDTAELTMKLLMVVKLTTYYASIPFSDNVYDLTKCKIFNTEPEAKECQQNFDDVRVVAVHFEEL